MHVTLPFKRVFITGGAGFIGSHLVDELCNRNIEVVVYDDLSQGRKENIQKWLKDPEFTFIQEDLLKRGRTLHLAVSECETVFHLAANPEVRTGSQNPREHYRQNVTATFNLLEAVRKSNSVRTLAFTSSSTVYGEPEEIPTPEDYGPLKPISVYGASKLASEALMMSYAHTYGFNVVIYRLANIVGPRMQHGVIRDFIDKLERNSEVLEVLGDGTQTKSYLDVDDCVNAMLLGASMHKGGTEIYNIGSEDQVNIEEIADTVCTAMDLKNVEYVFTGGVDGGRGWRGDVKIMLLDIERISTVGWKPKLSSREAVRKAARSLCIEGKRQFLRD